jgi:hypothetical protein
MFLLSRAGCHGELPAMQWLIDHGAMWPDVFYDDSDVKQCWSVLVVQWALAHGSGWRKWKYEDYADDDDYYYEDEKFAQRATELLDWAHTNGCPCTCGHVQQQQQQ